MTIIFSNFLAFGEHFSLDLKVNVDGGTDYIYQRATISAEELKQNSWERMIQINEVIEDAFKQLCVTLVAKGHREVSDYIEKQINGFDSEYVSTIFADSISFVFELNLIQFVTAPVH